MCAPCSCLVQQQTAGFRPPRPPVGSLTTIRPTHNLATTALPYLLEMTETESLTIPPTHYLATTAFAYLLGMTETECLTIPPTHNLATTTYSPIFRTAERQRVQQYFQPTTLLPQRLEIIETEFISFFLSHMPYKMSGCRSWFF